MTAEDAPVEGQVWRRKKDGKRITITRYAAAWEDAHWIDERGRRGAIFLYNLRRLYDLEPAPDSTATT